MPDVRVNKTAAYELNGQLFANMVDAEVAVRKEVISKMAQEANCIDDVVTMVAERWMQIKNDCDAAFKGI